MYLFSTGLVLGEPWAWVPGSLDPTSMSSLNYSNLPTLGLQGYCVDLLQQLADKMNFDYEIVPSTGPYAYGSKVLCHYVKWAPVEISSIDACMDCESPAKRNNLNA